MSAADDMRVGWCPGALRPMMSGDGLIVRVKPRGATVSVEQALALAALATRHGNGLLDLTARANLQIRGVSDAALRALTAALDALGLLDADAGAEARRNVVASPLMGLDLSAAFDVRPAVAALEARLAVEAGLAALPSKFGFAVSDGGRLPLDGVSADVRFEAISGGDRGRLAVRLDGDGEVAAVCDADDVPDASVRLAGVFVAARGIDPDLGRMRDLVARVGAEAILSRAGLEPATPSSASSTMLRMVPLLHSMEEDTRPTRSVSSSMEWRRGTARRAVEEAAGALPATGLPRCVGRIDLRGLLALGVAAPFGRFDAAQLDALARGAARAGAAELRLTPWRVLLVPGLAPGAVSRLAEDCAAAGLVVDPADPRLRVAACAGAPGCRRGSTPVLAHAALWANLLGPGDAADGIALHVSGCEKGCAHPGPASLTLVAREGLYAFVPDGSAGAAPVAAGLDASEARRLLKTTLRWDRCP